METVMTFIKHSVTCLKFTGQFLKFSAKILKLYFTTIYKGLRDDSVNRHRATLAPNVGRANPVPPASYINQCEEEAAAKKRRRRRRRKTLDLFEILFD
jgi:hypothetical protein